MKKHLIPVALSASLFALYDLSGAPLEPAPAQRIAKSRPAAESTLKAMPDLQVLGYRREAARESRVEIRVKNTGAAPAGACHGIASAIFPSGLEASPAAKFNIPALAPGAKIDVAVDIVPPPKNQGAYLGENSHVVTIVADARRQVQELQENNNTFKHTEKAQGASTGSQVFGENWSK